MKRERRRKEKTNMIGTRVMQARQEQGLSRSDLVDKLHCLGIKMSVRTLSLLERKKRRVFDKEFLALAIALNVSLEWLWEEEKKNEKGDSDSA